jgi:hypothetical protein
MDSKRRDIKMKRILYVFALLAVLLVVSIPAARVQISLAPADPR